VFVVDEEIAILAELHARQRLQCLALLRGQGLAAGFDARQRSARQLHIVAQLGLLAVQVGGLHQLAFLVRQFQRLMLHGGGNQAQCDQDGGDRQKCKFQRQLHGGLCGVHRRSFPPSARTLSTGLARMAQAARAEACEWPQSYLPSTSVTCQSMQIHALVKRGRNIPRKIPWKMVCAHERISH
jgi:hypothetical protein